ncbi:MAG: hypothetical protein UW69_C0014G0012 [Microgenomates group bacterium GW2011_GWA2_44_7]|nr:MAG: hypothetical protein UW69_C0014G0012 [Microgenomates group bacterium GW2011_GWA2_44_7]KKT78188.1 MAG: hypothetical protein UW73_C0005G0013 [Microgenomates group bacterium GW2011_GWB1_44_8]
MITRGHLQPNIKSKIIEHGYINVYSELTKEEKRQLYYNREYKKLSPLWDNSLILMSNYFEKTRNLLGKRKIRVLDAGCGNGNYVIDERRSKIAFAAGVDIDQSATRNNVCLDEIKFSNLEKISYPDNSFDIVLSLWVIEHLSNPEKVFREIKRVLKPGGFLLFCTSNKNYLPVRLKRYIGDQKLREWLISKLYGRKVQDIFDTPYLANDVSNLQTILTDTGYDEIDLHLNYDPGYTSFNSLSFSISNLLNQYFPHLFKPHLIGRGRKKPRK